MIRIRHAIPEDRETIATIHAASWRDSYAESLPQSYLKTRVDEDLAAHWQQQTISDRDLVMVAEDKDQLLGFIAIWCRPEAFIDNLHVLPDYRSLGIGSNLLGVAATSLLVRGHQEASLWVFESNQAAIRFYQRCGAVVIDQQEKEFFGHRVKNLRLYWSDISTILPATRKRKRRLDG